jgi:hypothetical protein
MHRLSQMNSMVQILNRRLLKKNNNNNKIIKNSQRKSIHKANNIILFAFQFIKLKFRM